jgi:hypothetical protein
VYLEALIVIAVVAAVVSVTAGGARAWAPPGAARGGLAQPAAATAQRLRFEAALRRACRRVELPYWLTRWEAAVRGDGPGVEVAYLDGAPRRDLEVIVAGEAGRRRVELRVDGLLQGALGGLEDAAVEPWVSASGVLLGLRFGYRVPGRGRAGAGDRRRELFLPFATPGGTL